MEFSIESPFSLDIEEQLFPLPSLSSCTDISVPQLPSISPLETDNSISQKPKNGRRRNTTSDASNDMWSANEHQKKKIMHRDVERQRRKEMSTLCTNLRSLLPDEYLKGKRSICDHMHETIKYIQCMQSNIVKLSYKRDELKKLSGENLAANTVETLNSSKRDWVVVRSRNGTEVQVVLNTATQHRLPVSNVLQALAEEGLEILSCISTKVNERFLHTIECQAVENAGRYRSIDVSKLQYKLMNLEYFPLD